MNKAAAIRKQSPSPKNSKQSTSPKKKANPTEGTWIYDTTGKYYSPDGVIRMNGVVICKMTPSVFGIPNREETHANAHLMSAAKEMRAAIEKAIVALDEGPSYQGEILDVIAECREAIEKADAR